MWWPAVDDVAANLFAWLISEKGGDVFGVAVLAVLGLVGLIRWHRRQRAAKKLGMAGLHFLIPCFLVALLAVVGLTYGLTLRSIPAVAALSPPSSPPTARQAPLTKNYFGPEKVELGTLLSKISDQLNGDALTAAKQGYHYYDATMPASKAELEALMHQAEGTANLVHSVWNQIWDTVDNNPKFKAELVGMVGQREGQSPNAMTPINKFYNSLQLFQRDLSILVDRIDELPEKDRAWIILGTAKRSAENVVYRSTDFQAWINECNGRIDNMREALR